MRGGKREGAGRKKKDGEVLQVMSLRVTAEEKEAVKAFLQDMRNGEAAPAVNDSWCKVSEADAIAKYEYYIEKILDYKLLYNPAPDDRNRLSYYWDLCSIYADFLGITQDDIKKTVNEHPRMKKFEVKYAEMLKMKELEKQLMY